MSDAQKNPPPLLNRSFVLITFLGCLYFFNFHSFLLLPIRISELGGTEKIVGFVMGIAGLSTLFLTPYAGHITDRYGKKLFMLLGFALLAASTFPLAFLNKVDYLYYVIRIVHGCSFSLFFVAAGALTVDVSSEQRRAQALGIYGVFTIINYAIAPYVGSILIKNFGFDFFIFFLTVTALLGLAVSFMIGEEKKTEAPKDKGPSYADCLRGKATYVSSATLFICGAAFITTFNFISIFSLSINIENFHVYFLSYTVSVLAIRLFLGWVPDKYGKWRVASPFVFFLGLSVFMLSFVHEIKLLVLCGIIFGCAHGFVYPSIYSIIIESNPKEARAKAFAISSVSFTGGGMLGSFVFGMVAELFGFRMMFVSMALMVFLGFLLFTRSSVPREHKV